MKKILLFLFAILMPMSTAIIAIAQEEMYIEDLEDLLADYLYDDEPGMVLYIGNRNESVTVSYGLANLDTGEAIQNNDYFRIGSITKPFVATLILQLVQDGELSLEDRIADYLPADMVQNIENADSATVRQMLQMTSGVYSYTDSDAFDDATIDTPTYPWTAAETLAFAYGEEAYFPTGTDYYYSNSNYNLAQIIIESLTGKSLADNLQTRIFDPLGMDTCFLEETPSRFGERIVRGYALDDDDEFVDVTLVNDGVGLGDGGIVCTAHDLAKFPFGLIDGDLLNADTLAEMLNTVTDDSGGQYGLGIGYDEDEFGTILGHDGATSGFQSTMMLLVEEDLVVVILTNNFDSEWIADIAYEAMAYALEE